MNGPTTRPLEREKIVKMKRISPGIVGTAAIAVLSMVYLREAWDLPFGDLSAPDMGFFPKCLALFSILLCLLLILKEGISPVRRKKNEPPSTGGPVPPFGRPDSSHGLAVVFTLLLYPLLLEWTGFLISTPLMLFAVLRLVRYRTWLRSLIVALVITATSYIVFSYWMGVYFPKGFLG